MCICIADHFKDFLSEVMSESDHVLSTDLEDPDILKDFNSRLIGAMIKQYARDSDIIGTSEYKEYLEEVRAFSIKCAEYLQTSIPVLNNDVIKSLTFVHLPERHQAVLDQLHMLKQRLPEVIIDMNALESEHLEYQAIPDDEFPAYFDEDDKPMCINHIWQQLSKQIGQYSGQPCFKHLAESARFLLVIPHSNSYCESIFNTTRKI